MNEPIHDSVSRFRQVTLASWGLMHVSGVDARAFLHGQLSNDLLNLPTGRAQWTAYCTAKGRMLAGFIVIDDGADGLFLICDRALIAGLAKRLRMFVLRAKVGIEDASEQYTVIGRIGDAPDHEPMSVSRAGPDCVVRLPAVEGQNRALVLRAGRTATAQGLEGETDWQALMIRAGEPWITPATQEQFVPQMVNFDAIDGISFKKGCYPGQEIVARAHYRGAVKRRMYRATVAAAAVPGQALFCAAPNAHECGQVVNAVASGAGTELLAVVPIDIRGQSQVHLGAAEGPVLAFSDLPYELTDAA